VDGRSDLFGLPVRMWVTRSCLMDIRYLLDGTPATQEPQDEQTDPTRLLRSLSSFCLSFVFTRDVVITPHVALPVVAAHVPPVVARTHVNERTPLFNKTDRR